MYSPIYWNLHFYRMVIRFLYWLARADMDEEYRLISKLADGEVLEVCCGDAYLSRFVDKSKYVGMDMNSYFAEKLRRKGLNIVTADITRDKVSSAENIIMIISLYHFLTSEVSPLEIIQKLRNASIKKTIICEPYQNISGWVEPLSQYLPFYFTYVSGNTAHKRFNKSSLQKLFSDSGADEVIETERSLIAVYKK